MFEQNGTQLSLKRRKSTMLEDVLDYNTRKSYKRTNHNWFVKLTKENLWYYFIWE